MSKQKPEEREVVFVKIVPPTKKERIADNAVQLGIALAIPLAGVVAVSAISAVDNLRAKYEIRRAIKNNEPLDDEE